MPVFSYTVTSGGVSETANVSVNVVAVNDPPVNGVPAAQSTNEDTARVFSTANNNALSVSDVDGGTLSTTVAVTNGTLTAVAFAGATITNNGSGSVTITGTAAAINGALNGLSFAPTADYNGGATLTLTTTDGTFSDTDTVAINVASIADIVADAVSTNEDTAISFNPITGTNGASADNFEGANPQITAINGTAIAVGGSVAVTNGSVSLAAGNVLTFTPAANFNGTVPVFSYTVTSGGVSETANVSVNVVAVNDAPTVGSSSASVSEEGLSGGIQDATGNPSDTTNAQSVSGTIAISDIDSTPTITLTAPAGVLTSGGVAVTWTGNGTSASPLVGSASGVEVLRAAIDNTGNYTITLSKAIDHPTGSNENIRSLNFGVTATDPGSPSATATGTITLNIEDDAPAAVASTRVVTLPAINTNIELILDVSGSMGSAVGNTTRLQIMKDSVALLLDQYDNLGDIKVRIVTFSDAAAANSAGWVSIAQAKTFVNALTANGGTNYDAAISTAQTSWTTPGKLVNAQNVSYFLTDGAPTAGQEMGAADEAIWTDFLNRNDINSFAYGMGTGATQANLDPIAYNGLGAGSNTAGVVVADITQLPPILRDSILTPSGGDIVTGGLGEGSGLGADGGFLRSVTIDGTTYTYDPAGNGTITTSGTNRGTFDTSTNTMTISTTAGGKFVVDMDNGLYTYTPPVSTSTTFNESIGFSLQDQDGDTAGNTLTITVNPPGTAPASAIDTGLTLTLSTTTAAVATSGLHGEYYGYNETANIAGNNYQAGDTTVGNADRVADLNTIINLREGSTIVGSGRTASAAASDATWNATNLTYGASPTVTGNLGTNPNIASGGTAVTSGALYNFLGAGNAGSNAGTLQTTSSFGNTTDSMLRFAGSAYFAAGNYDFRVLADDGFSIRIDGVTVFEFNDIQAPTTRTSTPIAIGEGMHTIEILYWEQGGNAALQVAYRPTGSATFNSLSLDNLAMFQSTELPVLSDLQDIVESPTNGQYLIRTGQEVTGSGSNDTITGSAGRDRIHGGDGNDTISAGTGTDWMEGGRGNDTLTGGAGSDTFRWQLSDRGLTGQPAVDTITDFDVTAARSGGDVLDLRDLLQGEAGVSNLQNYLDFNSANGSTVIRISTTGAFSNGTYSAAAADQEIVLQGVGNLRTSLGLATNATDTQVIQELINRGKLITD